LDKQLSQTQETLTRIQAQGKPSQAQQAKLAQLKTELSRLQSTQKRYHNLIQASASLAIDGRFQGATEVTVSFQHHLQALTKPAKAARLPKLPEAVDKFSALSGMAAAVHAWWLGTSQQDTVSQSTDEQLFSPASALVTGNNKLTKPKLSLKQAHSALTHAQLAYRHDPVTLSLSPESLQHWWSAEWMVSKFQRTSSRSRVVMATLSGFTTVPERPPTCTVIHNFDLKRSDGSTAAQRLFGRQFPNLFDYLVEHR